jgi:hypothetical protein
MLPNPVMGPRSPVFGNAPVLPPATEAPGKTNGPALPTGSKPTTPAANSGGPVTRLPDSSEIKQAELPVPGSASLTAGPLAIHEPPSMK